MQNDPDKPIVVANMFDAQHAPVQFASAGNLPDNAPLYGIRSKEIGGLGYGELQFDDTTAEQRPNYPPNTAKLSSIRAGLAILATKVHRKSGVKASNFAPIYPGAIRAARGCCFRQTPATMQAGAS